MADIRYPVAVLDGGLVWARELAAADERPEGARCVGCDELVRLRAGAKNRPHFAHLHDEVCVGGETALHQTTVRVLRAAILDAAAAGRPYRVLCACARCLASREADVARQGCAVAVDEVLEGRIRPDLLVRTGSGKPLVVIEVIVTHAPEEDAVELYERLGLPVIRVWPTLAALEQMRSALGQELLRTEERPTGCFGVSGCRFPRHSEPGKVACPTCAKPARQISVEITTASCYKCYKPFPVLDLVDCTDEHLFVIAAGCPDLPGVAAVAASRGVRMATRNSNAAGGSYLMHHASVVVHRKATTSSTAATTSQSTRRSRCGG
ncbi:MAG TPA: competence protein CoiA family protein [Acidimicrobiales bacterium]|nr:competence protein CoiA family protein [Acidimicrobiales bacterium]